MRKKKKGSSGFKKAFLRFFILMTIASISIAAVLIGYAYATLPDVAEMVDGYRQMESTVIYDSNGTEIDRIARENRELVPIEKIPKSLQNAFVAIEDRKFYTHKGFDIKRLAKAMFVNISQMRKAQGGSSITQQLAKNAFLTNERSIMRKVKEAIITIELERRYTKDDIMERYLSEIYFGEGAYGAQSASKLFFNKDVEKLTLAESALLAGVPNRPEKYSPFRHLDNALKRQKLVLSQMLKFELITQDEYNDAVNYEIKIDKGALAQRRIAKAPDFTDIVKRQAFDIIGEKEIYESGMKIYTTLDMNMQKAAEEAFYNNSFLKKDSELQGALVTIDSSSGYVKAIIGGKDFRTGFFNRAVYAKRQPGSAFKPFVYFTAVKNNFPVNLMIEDSYLKIGNWEPKNYSKNYGKTMTMLEALEKSQNVATIKLLQQLSIPEVIKTARDAGITSPIPENYTMGLGSMVVTPLELANAYAPFSNGGYKTKPIFITKIEDKDGKVVFEEKVDKQQVFKAEDVALIVNMMENVVKYGSGKAADIGIEQAGKTGTTNGYTDAWFTGFTPDLVTAVYVGYDNNKPMKSGMAGGKVSAPIWASYMNKLIARKIYKPGKFKFIERSVGNSKLMMVDIDISNGLIADSTSKNVRNSIFRTVNMPIEKAGKYKNGIAPLLNRKETSSEEDILDIIQDIPEFGPDNNSSSTVQGDGILD